MPDAEKKTEVTLFSTPGGKERQEAIKNLLAGKTPFKEIHHRPMRGGGEANFVNTYYMVRQINLLTGFRWKSECLEERLYPTIGEPREIGTLMKVTIWDNEGREYSHQDWGQKDVARHTKDDPKGNYKTGDPLSIFDDLKAAYSDGIKKCLSLFGIANDVYGGKELEFFSDEPPEEGKAEVDYGGDDAMKAFGKFLEKHAITWSEAFRIAGTNQITDYNEAYKKVKEAKGL